MSRHERPAAAHTLTLYDEPFCAGKPVARPRTHPPWEPYLVEARNISRDAGPSVHSDAVARGLGFRGALVAGRAIFSHLLHPALERYGEALLARWRGEVTFRKPAYEGDPLTVYTKDTLPRGAGPDFTAVAMNGEGEEVARLEADVPETMPAVHGWAPEPAPPFSGEKREGAWEALEPGDRLGAYPWRPSAAENAEWCEQIGEALPLFRKGAPPPLHPGLVPTATTALLHRDLVIRGWVHVSSRFLFHRLLRAGDALELRARVLEKWEKGERRFIQLHVSIVDTASGEVVGEEYRTALVRG